MTSEKITWKGFEKKRSSCILKDSHDILGVLPQASCSVLGAVAV